MTNESTFPEDLRAEQNVTKIIQTNHILENMGLTNVHHVSNIKRQLKGVDFTAEYRGYPINIDAKFIADFGFNTFAQEIAFRNKEGKYKIGWFMNNKLDTDHFLFLYIDVEGAYRNYTVGKNILKNDPSKATKLEALLVPKKALQRFITGNTGIMCTEENASTIIKKILELSPVEQEYNDIERFSVILTDEEYGYELSKQKKGEKKPDVYIAYTPQIKEAPMNYIVPKDILREISVGKLTTTLKQA